MAFYWQFNDSMEIGFSDRIKWNFFQAVAVSVLLYSCTSRALTKRFPKKTKCKLYEDYACCFKQILEVALYKSAEQSILGKTGELWSNTECCLE